MATLSSVRTQRTFAIKTNNKHDNKTMWLFTTMGFFSVTVSPTEPDKMQMRARLRGDLQNLDNAYGLGAEIIEAPEADYRWRIVLPREIVVNIIAATVAGIDYGNFKSAVHDTPGQESKAGPYMRVWSAMATLQREDTRREDVEREEQSLHEWSETIGSPDAFTLREPSPQARRDALRNPKGAAKAKKSKARKTLEEMTK